MPLIVDTYNVLHVTGVLPPELAGIETTDLARLIAASRYRREPATLVCDGTLPSGGDGGSIPAHIGVIYAGPGRSADDEIIRRIRRSSAPRQLLVVTSDRQILKEARKRRCRVVTSDAFLAQLAADQPHSASGSPSAPAPPGDVEHWLDVFGLPAASDSRVPDDGASGDGAPAIDPSPDPDPESPAAPPGDARADPAAALPRRLIDEAAAAWRAAHRRRH